MADARDKLFDRALLARRRARAARTMQAPDFLLRRAGEDIETRLGAMMREFPLALDLGAHHGVLTTLLRKDARIGRIVSADACLALVKQCKGTRLVCDEEMLPFADASLDLVISGLILHLVNDLPGTLIQIRRALKPDGLFMAAVLGGQSLHELREAFALAEEEVDGGVSPRVAPFGDVRDYGALLQRAGFALPVTDADAVQATYSTPLDLMRELRAMGASNVLTTRRKRPLKRGLLMRAGEIYAQNFPAPRGRIRATFEIIHLTGWAPDPSQPKALRPGSAQARLADALGTQEHPAGEKADPSGKP
ncbi:MAG: methyltransferase domain-containing protein [Methyloligellaceae bacterium]